MTTTPTIAPDALGSNAAEMATEPLPFAWANSTVNPPPWDISDDPTEVPFEFAASTANYTVAAFVAAKIRFS